jgi:hypothetical protein
VEGGNTIQSINQANAITAGQDAPRIVEYDEGYYNDSNVFTRYIPDNKVVVIGQRPGGQRIGEYVKTRNANNPGHGAGHVRVHDRQDRQRPRRPTADAAEHHVPPRPQRRAGRVLPRQHRRHVRLIGHSHQSQPTGDFRMANYKIVHTGVGQWKKGDVISDTHIHDLFKDGRDTHGNEVTYNDAHRSAAVQRLLDRARWSRAAML